VNRREVRHIARRDVSGVAAARLLVGGASKLPVFVGFSFRFVPANKTRRQSNCPYRNTGPVIGP
jgi:hypothetical protein